MKNTVFIRVITHLPIYEIIESIAKIKNKIKRDWLYP